MDPTHHTPPASQPDQARTTRPRPEAEGERQGELQAPGNRSSEVHVIDLTTDTDEEGDSRFPPSVHAMLQPEDNIILSSTAYLNDSIINTTLQHFRQINDDWDFHNTYFMEYVCNPRIPHPSMERWVREIIHSPKIWYVPVHHRKVHWLYLQINPSLRHVHQYDSLPAVTDVDYTIRMCESLSLYSTSDWTGNLADTPPQCNGYDCGVHVLAHIHHCLGSQPGDPLGRPSRALLLHMLQTQSLPDTLYSPVPSRPFTPSKRIRRQFPAGTRPVHPLGTAPLSRQVSAFRPCSVKTLTQTVLSFNTNTTNPGLSPYGTPRKSPSPSIPPILRQTFLDRAAPPDRIFCPHIPPPVDKKLARDTNGRSYGDLMTTKNSNIIRLYSQNINRLSVTDIPGSVRENLEIMKDRGVDMLGWAETNVEWNSYPLHLATYQVFKKVFPRGKWVTTTSAIPADKDLKPGGNALGLNQDINRRTHATGKDPLGRWTWATMEGKTRSITVVQLYIPCDTKQTGINTTFAQQYEQLQKLDPLKIPEVLRTFYRDLNSFLANLASLIILMGDFNEPPTGKNILDLQSRHNLRDIYEWRHPASPLYTHQMGTTRIDYFLVSAPLLPQVRKIGYEALNAGIQSDH